MRAVHIADARVVPAAGTVWEPVGEELVVWNADDRTLHRLDRVGRWLWELLEEGLTTGAVAERAAGAAGPDDAARARRDTAEFVSSLQQRGLARLVEPANRPNPLRGDGT